MKQLITFLLCLFTLFAEAQVNTNDTNKYFKSYDYGFSYKRLQAREAFIMPTDTVINKLGAVSLNGAIYLGNGIKWTSIGGGGSSTDTTSLSNRINQRIDSLRRSNDSIFARKNGVFVFQYKDSVGKTIQGLDSVLSVNNRAINKNIFIGTDSNSYKGFGFYLTGTPQNIDQNPELLINGVTNANYGVGIQANTSTNNYGKINFYNSNDGDKILKFPSGASGGAVINLPPSLLNGTAEGDTLATLYDVRNASGGGSSIDTTSLSNRINQRVPYTGATQQVNLGAYNLIVDSLTIGRGNNHSLSNNTAIGFNSLFHTTSGNFNTGVGYQAGHNLTTGQYNTAIGQSSLFTATTASQNTAIGLNSLLYTTSGGSNVAVGVEAMQHNQTGASNIAVGYNAGTHLADNITPNTFSNQSIFIGRDTKSKQGAQSNEIVIGHNMIGNGSNTVTIGNTLTTSNYFTGSINAGSFVKTGGTASQFLKANGSVDSSTYLTATDSVSLSNRINLKLNIADTTALQRKSIPSYSILANPTSATTNATAQGFRDTSGTYSGTITWTGTTAPSGATNHSYRLTQVGKCVTLHIALVFATNGAALTSVLLTLPAGAPTPVQPAGLTGASTNMYPVNAQLANAANTILSSSLRGFLRNNVGGNGFEIIINFATSAPAQLGVTLQYWTN